MTATTMNAPQYSPRVLGALLVLLAVLALAASMALPAKMKFHRKPDTALQAAKRAVAAEGDQAAQCNERNRK